MTNESTSNHTSRKCKELREKCLALQVNARRMVDAGRDGKEG